MLKPDPQPLSMGPTESATGGTELATFDRPRSDRPVQLGLVADPHVPVDDTEYQKLFAPTTMLERVVADATRREVDYLFSLGDLTKDGAPAEYEVLDDVLEALDVPFASVPGNHDVLKEFDSHDSLPVSRFADRYTPEGIPFAIDLADLTAVGDELTPGGHGTVDLYVSTGVSRRSCRPRRHVRAVRPGRHAVRSSGGILRASRIPTDGCRTRRYGGRASREHSPGSR